MAERFAFTIEERHMNTICEIECSEKYNEMLENGDNLELLNIFNNAISIISKRIREQRCNQEFTEEESDILALVLGLIEEE